MGATLARSGKSVIFVDANLASPSLHAYFGMKAPGCTLLDVLERPAALSEALTSTAEPGMRLLSCVGDELGMADLSSATVQKMIDTCAGLDADYVLIETGSGTSFSVLDFFSLGDVGIVVAAPDPASMQCTYGFIKNSIFRRIQRRFGSHPQVGAALQRMRQSAVAARPRTMTDFVELLQSAPEVVEGIAATVGAYRPLMLINMASADHDQRMAEIIQSATRKFLNVDLQLCGLVQYDPAVYRATQHMSLLEVMDAECPPMRQAGEIALRLADRDAAAVQPEPTPPAAGMPVTGLNDNMAFMGRNLHIQTEDMGVTGHCITTQVFCEGRVILSTKSDYASTMRNPHHNGDLVELMRTQHFNVIREIESRKTKSPVALS
jgi:flagellar biosynthesis protein FlhG